MVHVLILLLLAAHNLTDDAMAPFAATARSGKVCVAGTADFRAAGPCRPTQRAEFDVRGSNYFSWQSDDGQFVWLGNAAEASSVRFDASAVAVVALRIRRPESRDSVRRQTTLTLRSFSGQTWILAVTPENVDRLRRLALPPGKYDLTIETPGYLPAVRRGIATAKASSSEIPAIDLQPIPQISGVVRDRVTGDPIAGARIGVEDAMTSSDAAGRFRLAPFTIKPGYLTVHASGYASREVPLPAATAGRAELQPIFMTRGGVLRLTVARTCTGDCETTAVIFRRRDSVSPSGRWSRLDQKRSAQRNTEYVFDALAPGSYAVVLEGGEPLQRRVHYFTVEGDEEKAESLALQDRVLKGILTFDKLPLAGAKLTFSTNQSLWSGELRAGDDGAFSATVWEGGNWVLKIDVPAERTPFFSTRRLDEAAEQFWDVAIPSRDISGRVLEAKTGEPVSGAEVVDDFVSAAGSRRLYAVTDAGGRFRFSMLEPGDHAFQATAPEFIDSDTVRVHLADTDTHRDVQIGLDRGATLFLRIVDQQAAPVANAQVYDWVGKLGLENRSPYISDVWGIAAIPMRPRQQQPLYVIAPSGSFNILLADAGMETSREKPLAVTMPPAVAALRLIVTNGAKPAAGVQFLVRADGRFLPPRIWDLVSGAPGVAATMTDAQGQINVPALPAGVYEFWPYRTLSDLRNLFQAIDGRKPTRAVLVPGQNALEIAVNRQE